MTVKLSQDSFVALLTKSGLLTEGALRPLVTEFQSTEPGGPEEGERLAQFLIRKGQLTTWQARKLLQGKHKGFTLGKYKLLSLLGRGGMSSVYLAEHLVMRRRCAIKVLPSKQVNDSAALTRFHQEAQAVAALDDPNIVRAYDVDHVREGTNEIHFLVMEYVEGRSLQEIVDQDGPLRIPDAINYVCQAASGLDHAHDAGMVHRDIKPSNLLLDLGGTVKVLDMGLARFFEQSDQQSLTLQHDQRVLGTADYLSPEQAVDSHGVDTRSDIYSLGGTLYFLLTGHPPFPEGTLAQRLLAHQTKRPRPVSEIRPDVPASFSRILERMMAKHPNDRQSSAGAARDELLAWLEEHGAEFANLDRPSNIGKPDQDRRVPDPTSDGWSELAPEQFTPTPRPGPGAAPRRPGNSHVVSDPELGEFLSALSTEIDPTASDSDRMTGAKTVVSKEAPHTPPSKRLVVPDKPASSTALATSDSSVRPLPATATSDSHASRRSRLGTTRNALIGGALLLLVAGGGYIVWPAPEAATPPAAPAVVATSPADPGTATPAPPAGNTRPAVEPGLDITVGPEGHFATLGEAVDYVRENFRPLSTTDVRTIRVAGGQTYPESLVIDNSQFGAFPQGVRIVCEEAQPAILAPPGSDPIVTLLNVERFQLKGFELAGGGRPVAMRLEGYLVSSLFEQLTIQHVHTTAIQAVGIAGFAGKRVEFRDLLIQNCDASTVGLALDVGERPTKELLIYRCRFGGKLAAGIRLDGEGANVEIRECRFNDVLAGVRFAGASQRLENVTLSNNTFRGFTQGVAFSAAPIIGSRGVGFQKNLFAAGSGPEVVIESGGAAVDVAALTKGLATQFNWSDASGDLPAGALDVFTANGRRGTSAVSFAGTDAANVVTFLKPLATELQSAASDADPPKYIGAIPPGASP